MSRTALLALSVLVLVGSFVMPGPQPAAGVTCGGWSYSGCCGSGKKEEKRSCSDGSTQYRCVTGPC